MASLASAPFGAASDPGKRLSWLPVSYEDIVWDVDPRSGLPRSDAWRIGTTHKAAVPMKIARSKPDLPSEVTALVEEAAAAIRGFDTEFGRELTPYASILLRSESASSSEIEQPSASARKVAEAEVNGSGTEHAMLIVGNVRAMSAALDLADTLDVRAVLMVHEALMADSDPDIAGQLRTDQVWIGGKAVMGAGSPHDADFVPPTATRVGAYMDDLMAFTTRDDVSALVQAAVAHAQFETIHPLEDGNGRTGRALLQAMLRAKGLTASVSVPLSSGLLSDPGAYVDALTAYRAGDVSPIVECVARASLFDVANGRHLIEDLAEVARLWQERMAGLRADSGARRLANQLFRQPVVSAPLARQLLGVSGNEHRHLEMLTDRGILKPSTDYKTRNQTWRADDILAVLDAYAHRAGRCGRMR